MDAGTGFETSSGEILVENNSFRQASGDKRALAANPVLLR